MSSIDSLIREIAAVAVEEAVRKVATPSAFCNQHDAPIPKGPYLRAARAGAFPSSKIERLVVARVADVVAWIDSKRTHTEPPPPVAEDTTEADFVRALTDGRAA